MSYKKTIASFVGKTPLWRLGEPFRNMPRILFYHGVTQGYYDAKVQANQILLKDFKEQMEFLKRHYVFISIDEFYERFTLKDKFCGKEIILTFDDGYKNNLTIAAPYLQSLGIPFIVFVSTGCIEDFVPTYYIRSALLSKKLSKIDVTTIKKQFSITEKTIIPILEELITRIKTSNDIVVQNIIAEIEMQLGATNREEINSHFESERILSWREVVELNNLGAIIGSHSVNHSILHKNQQIETIDYQLKESKRQIIDHVGKCRYFAFPNGDRFSVCADSLKLSKDYYDMSFAVNGKSVGFQDPVCYVSRIGAAFELSILKTQLSLLS